MWVITHVLAGLALAAVLGGPWWLLVVLVLLAHVLMDLVPHWDYTASRHTVLYGSVDFSASFAAFLTAWLALGYPWWIAGMGLVSGAPDWDVVFWMARREKGRKLFPSHWTSFPHGHSGKAWGIGVQVVIMAVSVAGLLALRP